VLRLNLYHHTIHISQISTRKSPNVSWVELAHSLFMYMCVYLEKQFN